MRKIRAAGLDTSIVITTAHDEFSFAYKAIKMDIVDYMLKPFTTQELEDVLQKSSNVFHRRIFRSIPPKLQSRKNERTMASSTN